MAFPSYPPSRRIGTARRDPRTGNLLPGEYTGTGQPMGAAANSSSTPNLDRFQASQRPGSGFPGAPPARPAAPQPRPQSQFPGAPMVRGSTPSEITTFRNGPSTAPNPAAVAAAGTGRVVQTPWGPVSSTMAAPGSRPTDAVVSANGVSHLTPFQQVVKDHPAVGQAGTSANQQFVSSYLKSQQSGPQLPGEEMERDPRKIADNIYKPLRLDGFPQLPSTAGDIAAPPAIGGPTQPVMFAGANVGPTPWDIRPPAGGAQASGQRVAQGATGAVQTGASWIDRNIGTPTHNALVSTGDFMQGLTGQRSIPNPWGAPLVLPSQARTAYQAPSAASPTEAPKGQDTNWSLPPDPAAPSGAFAPKRLELNSPVRPRKRAMMLDEPGQQYGT